MSQVHRVAKVLLGGDPEFFFEGGGKVVGAEKVLKEGGKEVKSARVSESNTPSFDDFSAFVLDGVQVELNPAPHLCRQSLGHEIALAFHALRKHLKGMEGMSATMKTTIDLDPEELNSLSDKARVFGCEPSFNLYDSKSRIEVDASTYLKRSAGGHIHLGLEQSPPVFHDRKSLVPLLDTLLGLPCVLIDRDEGNVERRKHYGRAGEYRLPKHGLEYRTPSNFWLRAYPLTSLVMAQARMAVNVLGMKTVHPSVSWDASSSLLKEVDLSAVREAINTNDLDLAKGCWEPVKGWLKEHTTYYSSGLNSSTLSSFSSFAEGVQEKGLESYFGTDPIEHWCNLNGTWDGGWESFLHGLKKEEGQEHPF